MITGTTDTPSKIYDNTGIPNLSTGIRDTVDSRISSLLMLIRLTKYSTWVRAILDSVRRCSMRDMEPLPILIYPTSASRP